MVWFSLLFLPLVLWPLIAATRRGLLIGLGLLGALAFAQYAVISRWVFYEGQATMLAALVCLTIAVLVSGPSVEGEVEDEAPATATRRRISYVISNVCCVVVVLAMVYIVPMFTLMGRWSWIPPADAIQPLPAELSVRSTKPGYCASLSSNSSCTREFAIGAPDATPTQITDRLRGHFTDTRSCAFEHNRGTTPTDGYWWGECPLEGWPLDRHETSISLRELPDGTVSLTLYYLDDW
ncbi:MULTISPECIES: hypothetical protein [unclassified Nocardia]|uniref:hypothetical protein n=1 Tax=unclassified Nocardia TaxID=2637762 RepID=UPI0033A79861